MAARSDWEVTSWGDRMRGPFHSKREALSAKRAIERQEYSKSAYTTDLNLRVRRVPRANRRRNVQYGFFDQTGFHPLRASRDYDPDRAGDEYSDRPRRGAKKKSKAKSKRKNPLPSRWTPAKVRTDARGRVQVMLTGKAAKQAAAGR